MLSKLKPCFGRNLLLVSLFVLLLPRFAFPLETGEKYVEQAARFLAEGYDLQAILSYRQAIGSGLRDPSVMRDMALAYYRLGMLEEAIENMEVGVKISPRDPNMLTELGVLYGARGDNTKAISILKESLQLDPGQGDVYINLGLALFRQGDLKLAWQAARIAEKLHQNPILLVEKLQKSAEQEPGHYPFQDTGPVIALRQIVLDSEKQGEELIALWQQGASLVDFFQGWTGSEGQTFGGYIGALTENELKPEILAKVKNSKSFDLPVIVHTNNTYLLVQRIWPYAPQYWTAHKGETPKPSPTSPSRATSTDSSAPSALEATATAVKAAEAYKLEQVDSRKILLFTGSFQQQENAIAQILKLRELGFSAHYLEDQRSDGHLLYSVIAGEFSSSNDVVKARARLKDKGYDSFYFK